MPCAADGQTNWTGCLFLLEQIDNLGFKSFPVSVSLTFPTRLEHSFEMMKYEVSEVQVTWRMPPHSLCLLLCTVFQLITSSLPFCKEQNLVQKRNRRNASSEYNMICNMIFLLTVAIECDELCLCYSPAQRSKPAKPSCVTLSSWRKSHQLSLDCQETCTSRISNRLQPYVVTSRTSTIQCSETYQ